jgi:Nif-specific regulatory protein
MTDERPTLFPPCSGLNGPESASSCGRLSLLAKLSRFLSDEHDATRALSQVLRWLQRDQGFNRGVFTLLNENEDEAVADITAEGVPRDAGERMRYRPGEGITGRVIAGNAPVHLPGIRPEDGFLDRSGLRQGST